MSIDVPTPGNLIKTVSELVVSVNGKPDPIDLIRSQYGNGAGDIVPSGAFTLLTWGNQNGGDALDLSDPQNPVIIEAGVYCISTAIFCLASVGKLAFYELDLDAFGVDPLLTTLIDIGSGIGGNPGQPNGTLSLTFYVPAGGVLQAGVKHNVGSNHTFQFFAFVQRVA